MQMINPKLYKGIKYVLLDDLPEDQRINIIETLSQELFIKILVNGRVLSNCIQFKDYQFWHDNVYLAPVNGDAVSPMKN